MIFMPIARKLWCEEEVLELSDYNRLKTVHSLPEGNSQLLALVKEKGVETQRVFVELLLADQPYLCCHGDREVLKIVSQGEALNMRLQEH